MFWHVVRAVPKYSSPAEESSISRPSRKAHDQKAHTVRGLVKLQIANFDCLLRDSVLEATLPDHGISRQNSPVSTSHDAAFCVFALDISGCPKNYVEAL